MSKLNSGGAAFPCETDTLGRSFAYSKMDHEFGAVPSFKVVAQSGMTLRQWYAGMALQGYLTSSISSIEFMAEEGRISASKIAAVAAFKFADAMISESQKEPKQ